MASPAEVVAASFAQANNYAAAAQAQLSGFTSALNGSVYSPPTISVTWSSLSAPTLPALPSVPNMPVISFSAPTAPGAWEPAEPSISIPGFSESAPTLNLPTAPTLDFGTAPVIPAVASISMPTAPTLDFGTAPVIPAIGAISLPTAPALTEVSEPTYLAIQTPTFSGIDLHEDYLAKLDDIPTLTLVEPTPYTYALGPEYASELLRGLKSTLIARLGGGTGLNPAVEQAIWDRARDRETKTALGNEGDIMRSAEALGFQLPPGVLSAQVRDAQKNYYEKLSGLSRDIAIKQADMEQENLKQTIAAGMDLEGKLIDYSYKLEALTFESAKVTAENAIAANNAKVEQFKALVSAFNTYASAYDAIIKAELGKVEVYKAEIAAEQSKADINNAMVQQYKAAIEASMSRVEIYKAEIGAANALVGIEQAKVGAAGEQIKAYVALVNAETSKIEAYKAEIGAANALVGLEQTKIGAAGEQVKAFTALVNAETSKVEAYKVGVEAENSKINIYKIKADVFGIQANAQAEKARAEISRYSAMAQAKQSEWDGYKAMVFAESERIRSLSIQTEASLSGYKAGAAAIESQATMVARMWETQIKEYEAGQNIALQTAKINGDWSVNTNSIRTDAAKVGAQVYAQLTSSAYNMIHAQASVSAAGNNTVSYNYQNSTSTKPGSVTSI